ncbi:MAG: deoxyribodipyrimidine photo-lyase [Alphaproteobacteria bacterium]|nr:deoxyribodipyrimidine photo-lyase [Alphaproteobacteria bacterium]
MTKNTAIVWFRNDLRLADHPALTAAAAAHEEIILLYVLDERGPFARRGAAAWWLDGSLRSLRDDIEARGGRLTLRRGPGGDIVREVVDASGARAVYWNRRYDPGGIEEDTRLKADLKADGVDVHSCNGSLLREPWELETTTGGFYKVYTPFWRSLRAAGPARPTPLETPQRLSTPGRPPRSDDLDDWRLTPAKPDWASGFSKVWSPGEANALKRLERFLNNAVGSYPDDRNRPDLEGTSRLSPHIAFGEISPNQIWRATMAHCDRHDRDSGPADKFLSEIAWRDFAYNLLYHYPDIGVAPIKEEFASFPWRDDSDAFAKWSRGRTGIPIVDAGMRQLWHTGWMHNRVRMIVASFLCKNLLVHWGEGERWFWDTLVDADPANNTASWQWVAGSGADAAPYFRIFNPVTQSQKFDPSGDYIREFVPELAKLQSKKIHEPWTASSDELRAAGVALGKNYPLPIVDLGETRKRALAAYEETRAA